MVLQDLGASRIPPVITSPTSPSAWQPTMEMEMVERMVVVVLFNRGVEGFVGEEDLSTQVHMYDSMILLKGVLRGRVIVSFISVLGRYLGTFLMLHWVTNQIPFGQSSTLR